jgi:hypothetical protein
LKRKPSVEIIAFSKIYLGASQRYMFTKLL